VKALEPGHLREIDHSDPSDNDSIELTTVPHTHEGDERIIIASRAPEFVQVWPAGDGGRAARLRLCRHIAAGVLCITLEISLIIVILILVVRYFSN
jgi:hypothetical protein